MPQAAGARRLRDDDVEMTPRAAPRLRVVDGGQAPERRTITITGNPNPVIARRRPSRAEQRIAARPDRVALWAVLLGLFLVLMAVATASAAPA